VTGTLVPLEHGAPDDLLLGDPFGTGKCLQRLFKFFVGANGQCH
jgi:hypothetical protein